METVRTIDRSTPTVFGTGLPGMLREQVDHNPDATAVTYRNERISYGELERESARLAAYLCEAGAGTDQCVGIYVEPSIDLMIGVWGTLFAGAAYLPLSPEYPDDRVRYMIEDSGTKVILTQDHLADRLDGLTPHGTRIITMADVRESADVAPLPVCPPDALAYVIYTSGSTGKPKGVMIENRSIMSQMNWLRKCGHLNADTTILQKTPMSFDAAQWEILAPAAGCRVVMGAPGSYRDPDALIDTIMANEVTTLQCVPTLLQALLDNERFRDCASLRRVYSGGESLSSQLAHAFTAQFPAVSLVNLYGPTECTINAVTYRVDPAEIGDGTGSVPIGVPVDATQCFILDGEMTPVAIGETGELYIGGVQLARGYLHQPDQTRELFVPSPFDAGERLYRTGDLASWNPDGSIQCIGRADDQVKLRGYRIELSEIALAIEEHIWVRRAAAVVTDNPRTGSPSLVGYVELNPKEAALMDQGAHGTHHESKTNKLQVNAQLASPGLRDDDELAGRSVTTLPGRTETAAARRRIFARKTYRFYDGGEVSMADIQALLAGGSPIATSRGLDELTFTEFGEILRWFGQYYSPDRLLPKYAYASPGALYATQLYLELAGVAGLDSGLYYYHPAEHTLVRIDDAPASTEPRFTVHFVGKKRAIEPVYKHNIQEVLEFEAGHMVGVFHQVLPEYGLGIRPLGYQPSVKDRLDIADEDYYLGTFEIGSPDRMPADDDPTEIFVQAHPDKVDDMPAGLYRYANGELERVSDKLVLSKHVIAINQQVFDRASFGITAISRSEQEWLKYIVLGATLHRLQCNDLGLGLMSSGYSSKTGNPLPAALRIDDILYWAGISSGASYFFLGGMVSDEQISSEGMQEDAVHMKGPIEMIKAELAHFLPDYMIPDRLLVLDQLPLTANGKVDSKAIAASDKVRAIESSTPYVAPSTRHERMLATWWGEALKYQDVSVEDEFFASGGNSLTAVALVNKINNEFGSELPLQVIFECPKLADLAVRIELDAGESSLRLVPLHKEGTAGAVFCWPGLGGYPMNLRPLAREVNIDRLFYGVQACGINAGEAPYPTIRDMAAADIAEIRRVQPEGPYTLWGYSFGARVAFEAAWQLEQSGHQVDELLLICPGNPSMGGTAGGERSASYDDPAYVAVLFSVFAGTNSGPEVDRCRAATRSEDSFVAFVHDRFPALGRDLIRRIVKIVGETYEFEYSFRELAERSLNTRVTIFKAKGDDYSFIEGQSGYSASLPAVVNLEGDHYSVLREQGVAELASAIRDLPQEETSQA